MAPKTKKKIDPAQPCTFVLFGASGDLAERKLYPTLYNLSREKLLSPHFALIGFARKDMTDESYREQVSTRLKEAYGTSYDAKLGEELVSRFYYFKGDSSDKESFAGLKKLIAEVDAKNKTKSNVLFFLATPPQLFSEIPKGLAEQDLLKEEGSSWRRIIIEKPFGHDFKSAQKLNADLLKVMKESQIYRVDHYLGKETVQNLMVFRFANGIFEPLWNHKYIDSVQIHVAETLGVEKRGGYYDSAGALRDMITNHLFQLLALIAMEPPNSFDPDDVRTEKTKSLKAIKPFTPDSIAKNVVRGQYGPGVMDGKKVVAYRSEENVDKKSNTETFVAMKIEIDNWRWAKVPFFLRTGKRLAERVTEIIIQFKNAPYQMFRESPVEQIEPNQLVLQIQPEERITLSFTGKIPGPKVHLQEVKMSFDYVDYFGNRPSTGYETLIYDCMIGDATLFMRADQIEVSWQTIDPILKTWAEEKAADFPNYASGTWGPQEAVDLLKSYGCAVPSEAGP